MTGCLLTLDNIELLVEFEQQARETEADIFVDGFDAVQFRKSTEDALGNPQFSNARCLLCVEDEKVIGRLDYCIISSLSFSGNIQVYVDWVYVLKECRHRGVAQFLFSQMEEMIKAMGISEYFLHMAENDEAMRFYGNVKGAEISAVDVLRKLL